MSAWRRIAPGHYRHPDGAEIHADSTGRRWTLTPADGAAAIQGSSLRDLARRYASSGPYRAREAATAALLALLEHTSGREVAWQARQRLEPTARHWHPRADQWARIALARARRDGLDAEQGRARDLIAEIGGTP